MPALRIRSDHDALTQIAQSFQRQADNSRKTLDQLKQNMDTLQNGDWIGKGATAFYQEMNSAVLPAVQRLVSALEQAQRTTQQISQIMQAVEQETAVIFRADGAGGSGGAAGGTAGAGGASGSGGSGGAGGAGGASGSGASGGAGAGGSSGGGAGGAAKKAADPRAEAVQKKIDAGDKQGAIDEAIKQYGIDTSNTKGKPTYDSSIDADTEAETDPDGTMRIGDRAFSSPGWLASSIGHESIHTNQAAEGRWYTDTQGTAINEIESYDWEIAHASSNGLTKAEIAELKSRRKVEYDSLTKDNKKRVDSGNYTLP